MKGLVLTSTSPLPPPPCALLCALPAPELLFPWGSSRCERALKVPPCLVLADSSILVS